MHGVNQIYSFLEIQYNCDINLNINHSGRDDR